MEAKKALRIYRGPDSPHEFMEHINSMSFQCQNRDKLSKSNIIRERRTLPWGEVSVTRFGAMATGLRGVEIVTTKGKAQGDIIILGEDYSGVSVGVRIYDAYTGLLLRKFATLINGPIVSADKNTFHKYSFTDHHTVSYYSKFGYWGVQTYGVSFSAGVVNYAIGYLGYDVISGWLYPDPAEPGGNTQYLYLYKDDVYVGGTSFSRTDAHVTMATGVAITEDGVYVTVIDYDIVLGLITNLVNLIAKFDLTMTYVGATAPEASTGKMAQNPKGSSRFIVYTYDLGTTAWCLLPTLGSPYEFAIESGSGFFSPLGVIKDVYFIWRRPYSGDKTITIIAYDLSNSGAEKFRYELNAVEQLDIWRGVTAEDVKL